MASSVLEPHVRVSIFNHWNHKKSQATPISSSFKKLNTSKAPDLWFFVSCCSSSSPKYIRSKCIGRFPITPFCQNIRDFSNSIRKTFSCLEASTDNFLQSGGIGMVLLSMTTTAKGRISPYVTTLAANPTFKSGLIAWVIAQSMKFFLKFFLEKKWDLGVLFSSGGMPSSHSALCTALTTSVAICHGIGDSLFPVCLGFTLIVMYDAAGVRRHAGMQAEVLNMIVEDLFEGHPLSGRKLKELLGHTPSQVIAGAVLGIIVAYICCQGCLVAI